MSKQSVRIDVTPPMALRHSHPVAQFDPQRSQDRCNAPDGTETNRAKKTQPPIFVRIDVTPPMALRLWYLPIPLPWWKKSG